MALPFQTWMLSSCAVADRCAFVSSLATSRGPVLRAPRRSCRDPSIASSLAQRVVDLQGSVHRIVAVDCVFDLLKVLLGLTERAVVALVGARTVELSHRTAPPFRSFSRVRQMRGKELIDSVRLITLDLSGSVASE